MSLFIVAHGSSAPALHFGCLELAVPGLISELSFGMTCLLLVVAEYGRSSIVEQQANRLNTVVEKSCTKPNGMVIDHMQK